MREDKTNKYNKFLCSFNERKIAEYDKIINKMICSMKNADKALINAARQRDDEMKREIRGLKKKLNAYIDLIEVCHTFSLFNYLIMYTLVMMLMDFGKILKSTKNV